MGKKSELIKNYSARVIETLREQAVTGPRTYGFEYEFLSETPLSLDVMEEIYGFLPSCGFLSEEDRFISSAGIYLTFEPGGQIEYHSIPMPGWDKSRFRETISLIEGTNKAILEKVGVNYLGVGYLPGRGEAPLCLTSRRYRNLHARMKRCGTRGREMMKGTASIHLHVGIRHVRELVPFFHRLCELSTSEAFGMSPDRRDIWDNTDPGRCGGGVCSDRKFADPEELIRNLVGFALEAQTIKENIPFIEKGDLSFGEFFYHLTTIFTDVRLNLKRNTVELRTLDSMRPDRFEAKWRQFISIVQKV
jgi:gamma-glutamylcysteine synthetase